MNPVHHPVHQAMEDIYQSGHTPRLHINASLPTVRVPDHVRDTWAARLVIDLDANYPLRMHTDGKGLEVDLSFQGRVSRCFFPWRAVYVVADRDNGKGSVFAEHFPANLVNDGSYGEATAESGVPTAEASDENTKRVHLSLVPSAKARQTRPAPRPRMVHNENQDAAAPRKRSKRPAAEPEQDQAELSIAPRLAPAKPALVTNDETSASADPPKNRPTLRLIRRDDQLDE